MEKRSIAIFGIPAGESMKKTAKILGAMMIVMGTLFTLMIILAWTTAPFWIRYNLGMSKAGIHRPPEYIVFLGGGGMPSESALMRSYFTARVASHYTRAKVIIAQPGNLSDTLQSLYQVRQELVMRGIDSRRILFEPKGTNTRAQALLTRALLTKENQDLSGGARGSSLLLVTSPEHLYRAVLAFKKAGFLKVDGVPAFEQDIETDLSFESGRLGGRKYIPDVGDNITMRYKFWTHLGYEIEILREVAAIAYYKLMGWI